MKLVEGVRPVRRAAIPLDMYVDATEVPDTPEEVAEEAAPALAPPPPPAEAATATATPDPELLQADPEATPPPDAPSGKER